MEYRTVLAIPGDAGGTDATPTPSYTSSDIPIPDAARLEFAIGLAPDENTPVQSVVFSVSIQSGNSTHEIFTRELSTADYADAAAAKWVDESIDLSAWTGQSARLTFFATAGETQYAGARWANPIVYSGLARPTAASPNVLIISLDTLRADHLGCYGYPRDTSPNIDRLAAESIVFEECMAPSSWTLPSHATMFTGLPPALHGAYAFSAPLLRGSNVTLSELARDAGFLTVAFTEGAYVGGPLGFYQGFDLYAHGKQTGPSPRGNASQTFAAAGDWLERHRDRPFMMFLHTYQIHWPYIPPDPYANKFTSSPVNSIEFFNKIRENDFNGNSFMVITKDPQERQTVKDLYDGGIAYTDALLGDLFARMERLGLMENTAIVIVSDHGEGFWEHGLASHGTVLYREMLHVPLIIRMPGKNPPAGRRTDLVALADLFPTVANWLGADHPVSGDAFDLNPLIRDGASSIARDFVTAHLSQEQLEWTMLSIQNANGRYIATTHYAQAESPLHGFFRAGNMPGPGAWESTLMNFLIAGGRDWWTVPAGDVRDRMLRSSREEVFLYPADRAEANDLSLADPNQLKPFRDDLAREVNRWKSEGASLQISESARPLSEEEKNELRALGYIH